MTSVLDQYSSQNFTMYNADCLEMLMQIPDNSIDLSVFSPPFAGLYIYSPSERDHGNTTDEQFFKIYGQVCRELLRVTKPGRICAIHVKDTVFYSGSNEIGARGLKPFTMNCLQTHIDAGWTYHRMTTVWRCPVREMQKTKADRLLYKNFRKDGARSGGGMPEYILAFRKWTDDITGTEPVLHSRKEYELEYWQELASPVWMSTQATNVLNKDAKTDEEAHICPMPLDLTERIIRQWSNPGEVVLSPYAGIGSEGYVAMETGRKFLGIELNPKYYNQAIKNIRTAENNGTSAKFI